MKAHEILVYIDSGLNVLRGLLVMLPLGAPTKVAIDAVIATCKAGLREAIDTDAVLNGEADGLPGVVVDER
jgi:hypothetical protein